MKRSENSHERNRAEFGIFDSQRAHYLYATKLVRTVFDIVCVVEAKYTTKRITVPG
jgi:hypothetical protein